MLYAGALAMKVLEDRADEKNPFDNWDAIWYNLTRKRNNKFKEKNKMLDCRRHKRITDSDKIAMAIQILQSIGR